MTFTLQILERVRAKHGRSFKSGPEIYIVIFLFERPEYHINVQSALKRNTENLHVAKQLLGLDRRIDSLRHLQCFSRRMAC